MKKEIWIHIDSYRPNGNAPANRAFAFANFFSKKGYKVNIITIGKTDCVDERDEATVYYLKDVFHFRKKTIINRTLDNFTFNKKTKAFLKRHRKQLMGSFFIVSIPEYISGSSCKIVKKYGSYLIVDVRDIWPEVAVEMGVFSKKSAPYYIFRRIADGFYDKCDCLITVSNAKTLYLQQYKNGIFSNKTHYVGNGFDLESLNIEPDYSVVKNIDLNSNFIVSYVGNVGKAQQLEVLIQLAVMNKDKTFIIAGEGAKLQSLKKMVIDNEVQNVIFTGVVSREQAVAITLKSNISFVSLSSSNMKDSVPTKLFESLGFGVPTLLIAEGEACDILEKSKLGLSVSPNNIEQVFVNFDYLINNYEKLIENKRFCMDFIANNYSRQKSCEALLAIIEEIGVNN